MVNVNVIIRRGISTSSVSNSKINFRKFLLYNKAGTKEFKARQAKNPDPTMPFYRRGVRETGYKVDGQFVEIPEMIPELIVPNLEGFNLKPYVSYRSTEVTQDEFTSQDLFNAVYTYKIKEDFMKGELKENGEPLKPSEEELLTAEEATNRALKTGCDLFLSKKIVNEDVVVKPNSNKWYH